MTYGEYIAQQQQSIDEEIRDDSYIELGRTVGKAFSDGKQLVEK